MKHDTKIAVIVRSDLLAWQKVNVTAFLCSGVAATNPETIGENYKDGSGREYMPMFRQPYLYMGQIEMDYLELWIEHFQEK